MGFQSNVSYELVFTDSINSSLSAGVHEWLSETTMTFLTPVWSDLYVAAQTQVTLAAGGSDIDLDNSSSTLLYSFDPLWFPETFTPTIGLAEGGTRVTLSGVGFNAEDFYSCRFSFYEGGWLLHEQEVAAQNVSSSEVRCDTPLWTFSAKSAAVTLWRVPTAADSGFNASLLRSARATAVQEQVFSQGSVNYFKFLEVWTAIAPLQGGAAGGHPITIAGIGWDDGTTEVLEMPFGQPEVAAAREYVLRFEGLAGAGNASELVVAEGACEVRSWAELVCVTPAWPAPASVANMSVEVRYTIEDGFFRRVQRRLIRSVNSTAALPFAFAPEWTALLPAFADKLGGVQVTVTGSGFASAVSYQCNFTGLADGREILVAASFVSTAQLLCDPLPLWSDAQWSAFSPAHAVFSLLAGAGAVPTLADPAFAFVFVNKPPAFTATNLIVPGRNPPRNYSEPWLTFQSPGWFGGVPPNGSAAVDETSQNVTFVIEAFPTLLFEEPPVVRGDRLEFTIAGTYVGVATLRVYLVDNGGAAWGGSNVSAVQDYYIQVLQYAKPPSFVALENVTVLEHTLLNSGVYDIVDFVTDISDPPNNLLQQLSIALSFPTGNASLSLFASAPQISLDGRLRFALNPWQYGEVLVSLILSADDAAAVANFTIYVLPVNQAPSFVLADAAVGNMSALLEGSGAYAGANLAVNISKGPPVDNEDGQQLSFRVLLVEGSPALFVPFLRGEANCSAADASAPPCAALLDTSLAYIDTNGSVSFELAPFQHGSATFEASLIDDGTTANGGADTSVPARFNVTVLPVNSPPTFETEAVVVWEGAGNVSVLGVAVKISAGSPTGDEDWQRLSFMVWPSDAGAGNASDGSELFAAPVSIDANGTLHLALRPFANGEASFQVLLVDDGGSERGGLNTSLPRNFSVSVLPVNQPPLFRIQPSLLFRETDPDYSQAGFVTNISRGSPTGNEDSQSVTFAVELVNLTASFSTGPVVSLAADGSLSIVFTRFEYGSALFSVSLADDGGTERGGSNVSAPQLLELVVLPVNNPPSFELEPLVSVLEGDGETRVPAIATNISRGSPIGNEDHQNVTFSWRLRTGSLSLFAGPEAIVLGPEGNLSFTLAPFEFGTAVFELTLTDDGGSDNGGLNASEPQALTIHVEPVNNAPVFRIAPFVRVLVGTNFSSGRASLAAPVVSNISAGSPTGNEDAQQLTFSVVLANGSSHLLASPLAIAPDGFLTFVANEFDYGWVHFNVSVADDGGTAFGGRNVSETLPFAVHVVFVNHAPSFEIAEPEVTAWEGIKTLLPGFASNISKGSPTGSEDWQTLSFEVRILESSAPMFDPLNITISPEGDLFFTLARFENGFARFEVTLVDDGGTERGGENTSTTATFNVTVLPVNNRPEFALPTPVEVLEGSGAVSLPGVATGISRGSPNGNENAQNVTFVLTFQNGSQALFAAPDVSMDAQGTLSFLLAPYEYGAATFVVSLEDDGGTERGGLNTSVLQLLTVTVLPVNDAPTFEARDHVVWEDEGVVVVDGLASSISKGPPAPISNEDEQMLTFQLTYVNGSVGLFVAFSHAASLFECVNASTLPANSTLLNTSLSNSSCGAGFVQTQALFSPSVSNRVRLFPNGTMAFTLADHAFGAVRIALQLQDDGGRSNGGQDLSSSFAVTISVLSVNDAPTFALSDGDCLGGIISFGCSANLTTIIVRRNAFLVGESYVLRDFAGDVLVGPPNEAEQRVVFEVMQVAGASLLLSMPAVSANGTLEMTQTLDAVGEARFAVRAVDDGGVERGGVDRSKWEQFRLVVVSGVVDGIVTLSVPRSAFDAEGFVRNVSLVVSVPMERIAIVAIESLDNATASRRLLQTGTAVTLQIFLLTDAPAALQNIALLLTGLSGLPGVTSVNTTLAPVDDGDSSRFSLIAPDVTVYENQGAHTVLALTDIFSATEQFNFFGDQIIQFFASQINGTNSSFLFSVPPAVDPAICSRNGTACTTTISFETAPTANGEAWFMIRMSGSAVIRILRILVLPVNQPPSFDLMTELIVLDEDTASLTVPDFAVNISRGPPDESQQVLSFIIVPVASTGPLFFDGTPMPVATNLSDWLVDTISINPADGSLHVGLVPFAHGNVTFQVTLVDDGGVVVANTSVLGNPSSAPLNFTISTLPVNHIPVFELPNLALQVAEDCGPLMGGSCAGSIYSLPQFAQNIRAGPPNEADQGLSFTVLPLDCQVPRFSAGTLRNASAIYTVGCPPDLSFPGMSVRFERLFSAPVQVSPNGTLELSLIPDRHGIVRFSISLKDDGGLLRGGADLSPTVSFSIEILRVNDAPSFVLGAAAIQVNQDCMGYSPTVPDPNGWTWSTDQALCAAEQGAGNFRDGCWVPLWSCQYAPLGLGSGGSNRRLLNTAGSAAGCNGTLYPTCTCDPDPSCACACENMTFWAEVLLVDYALSQFIADQNTITLALAAAFDPLLVSTDAVTLRSVLNVTEIPYPKPSTRSLLAQGSGVSLLFSVSLFFDPAQSSFLADVAEQLRVTLVAAGVPEVAVVGWDVADSTVSVEIQAASCTPPEPPPRVQCQDGSYILTDLVRNIKAGGWGEEREAIWFEVVRISGPDLGPVDVRFPLRNVSRNAIFDFIPTQGRFGVSEYNITIIDSGGTANGGVDRYVSPTSLRITVQGQNVPPSFEFAQPVLFYSQDSACVETPTGGCDGFCFGGESLCVGGADDGSVCAGSGTCAGNCSGGSHIPVATTCTGTCSCPIVTDNGVQIVLATCDPPNGGFCSCEAPNTDARCFNSTQCTGGGSCTNTGACVAPADDGGNCTLSEQCSNRAACIPRQLAYLRHLHRARAIRITAGSDTEDGAGNCPAGTSLGNGCTFQTVTFTVVPRNLSLASSIFSELPYLSADGILTFNLTAGAFGAAEFDVTLKDDSGDAASDTSQVQTLLIGISPVNSEPSFDIPSTVTVLEDSGPYSGQIAFNIQSPNSIGGVVTIVEFRVVPDNTGLFLASAQPAINAAGVLSFTPAVDAFGQTLCQVTLLDFSRPDAGDAQLTKPLTLIVQPVNDQPTLTVINAASFFSVPINSDALTTPIFSNIRPGPANEGCFQAGDGCDRQTVSFIVVGIANPLLFEWFPAINSVTGELTFKVKPDATGSSSVTLGVIDDGFDLTSQAGCVWFNTTSFMGVAGNGADAPCLVDPAFAQAGGPSLLTTFGVQVYPEVGGNRNDVKVLYEVNCSDIIVESECTCPPLTESTVDDNLIPKIDPVCSLLSGAVADDFEPTVARVVIEGDQGPRSIENFATIIRENDYLPSSVSVYSVEVTTAGFDINFIERRQDAERNTPGLEYAVDLVYSPDGLYAYAAEPETDSVSVWKRNPATAPQVPGGGGEPLQFLSRRAYGEERLRFGGLADAPAFGVPSRPVLTPGLCGLASFEMGGEDLIAMAAGCEDFALDMDTKPNSTWSGGSAEALVGFWEMTTTAMYGDHVPGEFDEFGALDWTTGPSGATSSPNTPSINCLNRWCLAAVEATGTVSCRPGFGCSYSRPAVTLPNCREPGSGLTIYPATLENGAVRAHPDIKAEDVLPAAMFPGPKCRSAPGALDWMAAPAPMSMVNFLVNNGKYEAMQFDGALNPGLFLTNDIRTLVDRDPVVSKLPRQHMSVEAWVTVDAQRYLTATSTEYSGVIMGAASGRLGSESSLVTGTCNKGWMLSYGLILGGGGGGLSFRLQISLEKNEGNNGVGAFVVAEAFAEPPPGCSCALLGISSSCSCFAGKWQHVVATYDGTFLEIHINGKLARRKKACPDAPCGGIVYPADYHPIPGSPTVSCTANGPVPVTIGNYTDRSSGETQAHIGMIKHVALFKRALTEQEITARFNADLALSQSPMHWQRYWGKVPGISPSIDFFDASSLGGTGSASFTVKGLFRSDSVYQCVFVVDATTNVSTPGTVEPAARTLTFGGVAGSDLSGLFADRDTLTCTTPAWRFGARAVELVIVEDGAALWQKLCVQPECGYSSLIARASTPTTHGWSYLTPSPMDYRTLVPCPLDGATCPFAVLAPSAHGSKTRFRFTTASGLFTWNPNAWTGEAPVKSVVVTDGGSGHMSGVIRHTKPAGWADYDPLDFGWFVDAVDGALSLGAAQPGATASSARYAPGSGDTEWFIAFGPECAESGLDCLETPQLGRVTEMTVDSSLTSGCSSPGRIFTLDDAVTGGSGFVAEYAVSGGQMANITFATAADRGFNFSVAPFQLNISDAACSCNGGQDWSACITVRVNNASAQFSLQAELGFQHLSNFAVATQGVFGKVQCTTVAGCVPDTSTHGVMGAVAFESFVDAASGYTIVLAANYHDWQRKQVNSTVFVLRPSTLEPVVVQQVETAAATDVISFNVLGASPLRLVGFANFHGPAVLYKWTGGASVSAFVIASAGQGYVSGTVAMDSEFGSGFAGTFQVVDGGVVRVQISAGGSGYFPAAETKLRFGAGCAVDDSACTGTEMTGAVVAIEVVNASLLGNCSDGMQLFDVEGIGAGLAAQLNIDVSGAVSVVFPDAASHGRGYSPFDVKLAARLPPSLADPNASACTCDGSIELNACLAPQVAWNARLAALPLSTVAMPITEVQIAAGGAGYVPGRVYARSEAGSGFRMSFATNAATGQVTGLTMQGQGDGYYPDTEVGLSYGPLCAFNDERCGSTRMTGSITKVVIADPAGISGCAAEGTITLNGGGGTGFVARFQPLTRTGRMGRIYFLNAEDHGAGYDAALSSSLNVSTDSGCVCYGSLDFSACLYPWVASGVDLVPFPQSELRPQYCPGGDCQDLQQRSFRHPWHPDTENRGGSPMDLTRVFPLDAVGPVALEAFDMNGSTYLAVACYYDAARDTADTSSKVFKLTSLSTGPSSLEVEEVAALPTAGARDVVHFEAVGAPGWHWLFVSQDGPESLLFKSRGGPFELAQRVALRGGGKLLAFREGAQTFVLAAERDADSSSLLRFNGSHLLGVQDTTVLPQDSAGGQLLPSARAVAFARWEFGGIDYMLLGNGFNCSFAGLVEPTTCSKTTIYSSLFRQHIEPPLPLAGARSVAVSPDGLFVYITGYNSNALAGFNRDPATGELSFSAAASYIAGPTPPYYQVGGDLPQQGSDFPPLQGASAVVVSQDSRNVYVSAASEGAVYVLGRDMASGALSVLQVLRDGESNGGKVMDSLAGAAGLAVTAGSVYVSAQVDQAVSVFDRNPDGTLLYVDRIRAGERILTRFEQPVDEDAGPSWTDSSAPRRLSTSHAAGTRRRRLQQAGNSSGVPDWLSSARKTVPFEIDGVSYLGVAAGRNSPGGGTVAVYRWNEQDDAFEFLQTTGTRDPSPADIAFVLENSGAVAKPLLIVANTEGDTHVYLWRNGGFLLYQTVPRTRPDGRAIPPFIPNTGLPQCQRSGATTMTATMLGTPSPSNDTFVETAAPGLFYNSEFLTVPLYTCIPTALAQRLRVFKIDGTSYLGISYVWDQPASQPYKWYSLIYRWNRDGFAVLEDGSREQGFGFDMYQILPTSGATDFEFIAVPSWAVPASETGPLNLLVVSNYLSASVAGSLASEAVVWRHSRSAWNPLLRSRAGAFNLWQTIPTIGAYGLRSFVVPYQGVAAGQLLMLGIASRQSGEMDYEPASELWAFVDGAFVPWQQFDNIYGMTGMTALTEGQEVHIVVSVACDALCQSFAAANSNSTQRRRALLATGPSPITTSTVLQWDQRFGQLVFPMALTDTDHEAKFGMPVPDKERAEHSGAVLLNVSGVVHAATVRVGSLTLLALSSESDGVVLMEWDFPRIPGLEGATLVIPDPSDAGFMAVGETSRALVRVRRTPQYDSLGRLVSELTWGETLSEEPLPVDRLQSSRFALVQGLAGAERLDLHPPGCGLVAAANCTAVNASCPPPCEFLLVHSGVPRHTLPCGDAPPVSAVPPHLLVPTYVPPRCSEPVVVVELTSTTSADLFVVPPSIVDGTLTLEPRNGAFGTSQFLAYVEGSDFQYQFAVTVNPVRYPPTFEAVDVVVLEDSGVNVLQFAKNIQTGRAIQTTQHLLGMHFELFLPATGDCASLEAVPAVLPWLGTVYVADGVGYGAVRFKWQANRWGTCRITAVLVDPEESDPLAQRSPQVSFSITALAVNDAPVFTLQYPVLPDVGQASPLVRVEEFVFQLGQIGSQFLGWSLGPYEDFCEEPRVLHRAFPCLCADGVFLGDRSIRCEYNFTIAKIEKQVAPGVFEPDTQVLFNRFEIGSADGNLEYLLNPGRFGTFRITIMMMDDGGTSRGGIDRSFDTVMLTVKQIIVPPSVEGYTEDLYRPLRLPFPLPDVPPAEEDPLMADFADVPLKNITAINLTVPEMHFVVRQVYDDFLTDFVNGPPDQEEANELVLSIVSITNDFLFTQDATANETCTGCPQFNVGGRMGTLAFELTPFAYGVSTIEIELISIGEFGNVTSNFQIDLIVLPVNNPPSATLPDFLGVVEGSGVMEVPMFATNISVGPENEQWQQAMFSIQSEVDTPFLLRSSPVVSFNGSLTLNLTDERHGEGTLTVMLHDDGGRFVGGQSAALGFPKTLPLKVFPLPRVVSLSPCVGPVNAGWTVTVFGQYFGSHYSRNAPWSLLNNSNTSTFEDVAVLVDGMPCQRQVFVSDTQLLCDMPPGRGRKTIDVHVPGGESLSANGDVLSRWNRTGTYASGVVQADIYYAGGATGVTNTEEAGLVAFGPDMTVQPVASCASSSSSNASTTANNATTNSSAEGTCAAPSRPGQPASLSVVPGVGLTRSVRAIMPFQDRVVLGGSFLGGAARHLSYLVSWDGQKVAALAGGVDGTVNSLNRWDGKLVVGGAFSLLYGDQTLGQETLKSGGLGLWNGVEWSMAGGALVHGAVTCTHVQGSLLVVAGRFRKVGNTSASNIAMFDGRRWRALGEGLRARDVLAMAGSEQDLFVAGDISIAGSVQVGNLARWLMVEQEWRPMQEFNAVVRALALVGNRLFVGGDFSLAGILPAGAIAQTVLDGDGEVVWKEMGSVGGSIHSMLYNQGCVYIGGRFDSVAGREGVLAARNAARWCLDGAAEDRKSVV